MTEKLLISLGQPSPLGRRTFPGPDRIAAIEVDALAAMSGFGYRAKSLQAIAAMVCDGEIDPQSWADTARSDRSVSAEIGELPGIGPYARSCILALCGRFGNFRSTRYFAPVTRIPNGQFATTPVGAAGNILPIGSAASPRK